MLRRRTAYVIAVERIIVGVYSNLGRANRCAGRKERNIDHHLGIKIDGWHNGKLAHSLTHRGVKHLPYHPFVLKLNLGFGRMNIYINSARVGFKKDKIGGNAVNRNQLLVSPHHSFVQIRIFHIPVIHKEKLLAWTFLGTLGLTNKTRNFNY